jgi:homocysteine S-methyltransferase
MSTYRKALPQLGGTMFLTDGGLETTLVFLEGVELPYFAAFDLMRTESGQKLLLKYFQSYIAIAKARGYGFILESPTWRASADWGAKLGYSEAELAAANTDSVAMLIDLRDQHETPAMPTVVSGCVGPRGDGYDPDRIMTPMEARDYHAAQIRALKAGGADMITAITMTNIPEAIGVADAARQAGMPVAISFTLETDGKLPTGDALSDAIRAVDEATDSAPAYYMINCAHPVHFAGMLAEGGDWLARLRGLRANASTRSHAELDAAPDLDAGNPVELGGQYADLIRRHGQITVLGGCCGTDHRHVGQIAHACRHTH